MGRIYVDKTSRILYILKADAGTDIKKNKLEEEIGVTTKSIQRD